MSNLEKHLISAEQSKILSSEYQQTNYSDINSKRPPGLPDSKEYTYDLDVLKEYITFVEAELEKRGVKRKGIRVSMGKYPKDYSSPNFNSKYIGYQTVFFSPVDLENVTADGGTTTENLGKDNPVSRGVDDIPNMNYGQICPP